MAVPNQQPAPATKRDGALSPLAYPVFRAVWIATVVSSVGTWMQDIGNAWLMTSFSASPLRVSLVQAATTLPMFLLALPAGALADVVDRRRLLLFTQLWMSVAALTLGVLTLGGLTTANILLCFAFLIGAGSAMNSPAYQAVVPELIPREELQRAVSLNSMGINLARAIGPAIGGFLIAAAGPGVAFVVNGVSFIGVMLVLFRWKRKAVSQTLPAERLVGAIRAGFRYARHSPALHTVFARTTAFMLGASALWALFPLVARRELGLGAAGYGLLLTCMGAGAFAIVFALPIIRKHLAADMVVFASTLAFALAVASVAVIRRPILIAPVLLLAGAAWVSGLSTLSVAAQHSAPSWARARALSCYLLVWFGSIAAGSTIWGAVAGRFGTHFSMLLAAAVLVIGAFTWIPFRLDRFASLDLMPSHAWPAPQLALSPEPDAGPVLIEVEYRVAEAHVENFIHAMQDVRGERRRDGAVTCGLYRDLSDPTRFVETFVVESWLEHLRQHERVTVADEGFRRQVHQFLVEETEPAVKHLIAANNVGSGRTLRTA